MSFIALLDGNKMKWKIERKIKRNGEQPRDKRKVIPLRKKVVGNKDDFLAVNIDKRHNARIRNEPFLALIQMTESVIDIDRYATDNRNDKGGWALALASD